MKMDVKKITEKTMTKHDAAENVSCCRGGEGTTVKRLSNIDIMDYLDGTLEAARRAEVEEHLRVCAEDAELVAELKMAQIALHDWDQAEPVRVSDDFWPKLRAQLPEQPPRGWVHRLAAQAGAWLWPSQSRLGLSLRLAAVAVLLAIAVSFFAPQQARHRVVAKDLTPAERTFIQQSLDRHSNYVSSQPLGGPLQLAPGATRGDVRSADRSDDDDDGENRVP